MTVNATQEYGIFKDHNHPLRTVAESRRLTDSGWFAFPELTVTENDLVFRARLLGYAQCYPCYPDGETQARRTLTAAKQYLETRG